MLVMSELQTVQLLCCCWREAHFLRASWGGGGGGCPHVGIPSWAAALIMSFPVKSDQWEAARWAWSGPGIRMMKHCCGFCSSDSRLILQSFKHLAVLVSSYVSLVGRRCICRNAHMCLCSYCKYTFKIHLKLSSHIFQRTHTHTHGMIALAYQVQV